MEKIRSCNFASKMKERLRMRDSILVHIRSYQFFFIFCIFYLYYMLEGIFFVTRTDYERRSTASIAS